MKDSDILLLMRDDPPQGHRALFDEYYSYVYAVVINTIRGTGSSDDADECVIDVFAAVIRELDSGRDCPIKPYIGTVTRNRAISLRRSLISRNGRTSYIEEQQEELRSPEKVEEKAEGSAMSQLMMQKIEELGQPDSAIIMQKFFYGRNASEIGKMLGMKPAAVRMRCSRAVKKLRTLLKDFY